MHLGETAAPPGLSCRHKQSLNEGLRGPNTRQRREESAEKILNLKESPPPPSSFLPDDRHEWQRFLGSGLQKCYLDLVCHVSDSLNFQISSRCCSV